MKTKAGKHKYKIPPMSQLVAVYLKGEMYDTHIYTVHLGAMITHDFKVRGIPTQCSIDLDGKKIWFWPEPDRECEIKVQYLPPVQEF